MTVEIVNFIVWMCLGTFAVYLIFTARKETK